MRRATLASACLWIALAVASRVSATEPTSSDAATETVLVTSETGPVSAPAPAVRDTGVTVGLELQTRFLWRGIQFGREWTLVPSFNARAAGFYFAAAGTATPTSDTVTDYFGLTAGYRVERRWGSVSLAVSDWVYHRRTNPDGTPDTSRGWVWRFNRDGTGSHALDVNATYNGPAKFPIGVLASVIAFADPDESKYLQLSYPFEFPAQFTATAEVGMAFGKSRIWYLTDSDPVHVVNVALAVVRTTRLTNSISLPAGVRLTLNPDAQKYYVIGTIGLRFH